MSVPRIRGIPGAVPVLVMMADDRDDRIGEIDRGEDVRAESGVPLHRLEFGRCEFSGLVQDVFGHRQLAHVVQQGRGFDRLERALRR